MDLGQWTPYTPTPAQVQLPYVPAGANVRAAAPRGGLAPGANLPQPMKAIYLGLKGVIDPLAVHTIPRWISFLCLFGLFWYRILHTKAFFVSAYAVGIYLLNLFIGFITPRKDPETDSYILPVSNEEEYRPFLRKIPEFEFWKQGITVVMLGFLSTFNEAFNLPVYWPVLVVYFCILFFITLKAQIKEMIKYGYLPMSARKTRYADVGTGPVPAKAPKIKSPQ